MESPDITATVLASIITLFPLINPFGTAIALNPVFSQLPADEMPKAARRIAIYGFSILIGALLLGNLILRLFGVDISVVQFAGGLVIVSTGWQLLNADEMAGNQGVAVGKVDVSGKLFYPVTFPMTFGAGSIAGVLSLGAQYVKSGHMFVDVTAVLAIAAGIVVNTLIVFFVYASSTKFTARLHASGKLVANKLSAFLVFCVGFQVLYSAVSKLFPALIR